MLENPTADVAEILVLNPAWDTYIESLAQRLGKELGFEKAVELTLQRFILESNEFPLASPPRHYPFESMPAIVHIYLPSSHIADDIELSFAEAHETTSTIAHDLIVVAWYSEVKVVRPCPRSGYRFGLAYELNETIVRPMQYEPRGSVPTATTLQAGRDTLSRLLQRCASGRPDQSCMILECSDKYQHVLLSRGSLSGYDRALFESLQHCAAANGFFTFLAYCNQYTEHEEEEEHTKQHEGFECRIVVATTLSTFMHLVQG